MRPARLIRHIHQVICRREKNKFKYLLRYLAWAVQNPDKHAEALVVLKSRKQGTGKSTLGKVMLDVFGKHHGALVDDKERILGRFTDWLEHVSFVLAEEILFAGDPKTTDKLKSVITGETIQVEGKFRSCRQVPNRLKIIATSNHDHAVASGVHDRRNVVYDVSDERAGDRRWFDELYRDLDSGGTGQFLHFLLNLHLGDWHPRQILKTTESIEQQRMSGDTVAQWAQACIEADALVGGVLSRDLGDAISAQDLREAYQGFCRHSGQRPLGTEGFGKACTDMFGPRARLPALQSGGTGNERRPWGYRVPTGKIWQKKLDARLGIAGGRRR
jgi:phage/plasmid-associated DNA primase